MSKIDALLGANSNLIASAPRFDSMFVRDLGEAMDSCKGAPKIRLVSTSGEFLHLTLISTLSPELVVYPWWLMQHEYYGDHLSAADIAHDNRLDLSLNAPIVFAHHDRINRHSLWINPIESISLVSGRDRYRYTEFIDLMISPWSYNMWVDEFGSWICKGSMADRCS